MYFLLYSPSLLPFLPSLPPPQVMVNQDKTSQQLGALRAKIQELEVELQEFRSGRVVISEDGSLVMNDMANEITMLRTDNDKSVAIFF